MVSVAEVLLVVFGVDRIVRVLVEEVVLALVLETEVDDALVVVLLLLAIVVLVVEVVLAMHRRS